ncbi:hypothetical protein ACIRL0_00515 [Streptomyces sp. NPDC102365]|uniref:hypothetical protein n=1 Tax=Streptomyces sp. NPDC102365 TaxID=3366162 RepID=UPI003806E0E9
MSDALDKAEAAAREAATNSAAVQIALAALELAKTAQAQQAPAPHSCQQQHGRQGRSTGEWMAIGCAVCVGSIGIAFASIALAIGGMTVAVLALVLRSIWRDVQRKGR